MADKTVPEALVELAGEDEIQMSHGGVRHPYDFGFVPAMARLMRRHKRIAEPYLRLFSEIMFSPEGRLDRAEREMVAAVAAAAQDCRY